MVALGHYLHIVKGCVNRAYENEKLYQPQRKAMVCDQMLDLLCICYLTLRVLLSYKCKWETGMQDIMCNYSSNKSFTGYNTL